MHSEMSSPIIREAEKFRGLPGLSSAARKIWRASRSIWGPEGAQVAIGESRKFVEVLEKAERFAAFDEPVLIRGESGVGKESIAQSLYLLSDRRGKPYHAVNCPQFQEGNLTVSELFGHRKGSFTGATSHRKGCFEIADGGVVFLDEIGDLHLSAQTMLLRALATGEFQPLGSERKYRANVRVVAATNRPLEQLMVGGDFRNDLFFRLRYFPLDVPPLRERDDDWQLLAGHFLVQLERKHGVSKLFSREAIDYLGGYPWPGNVRELIAVVTTGYVMANGAEIQVEHFADLLTPYAHLQLQPPTATSSFAAALPKEVSHQAPSGPEKCDSGEFLREMQEDGTTFWESVRERYLDREINRSQATEVVRLGLQETRGRYRELLPLFNLPTREYHRFMDFLRHHRLKPGRRRAGDKRL